MGFTWFDFGAIFPFAAIVAFETRQEFGRALLDALAALLALYLAARFTDPVSVGFTLTAPAHVNTAVTFGALFVVFLILGLTASRFAHHFTRLTVERFDPVFGFVFGLAIAVIVGHGVVSVIWEYYEGSPPPLVARSWAANELLNLHTLRGVVGSVQQIVRAG
jgi:uncharacterized membrane protein required for colicin V production